MGWDRLSHEGRDSPLRVARRRRLGEGWLAGILVPVLNHEVLWLPFQP